MALPQYSTRVILNERPKPNINENTFKIDKQKISDLVPTKPSQVLVQVDYVSIDPAMRGWLDDRRSYIEPVAVGATMRAEGIGRVVKVYEGGGAIKFKVGDLVKCTPGTSRFSLSLSLF